VIRVAAIVAAGGRGTRLGAGVPKQVLDLCGVSVLQRSIDALLAAGLVETVVVALPADLAADPDQYVRPVPGRVRVVAGGERRQDSVARALEAVPAEAEVVLVHDAARPFVSRAVIARVAEAAAAHGAAVAAVRARDTVKRAAAGEGAVVVGGTLPREEIYLAQTPQGFSREVLAAAVRLGERLEATDEAMLAEAAGYRVHLVEGDERNMKITTAADLELARALTTGSVRTGIGYDLHRFVEGRPLVLGGVRIPHERGLHGHSDADAIAHAVTDAVLGAAALGDVGVLFPDTDPRWKDADSMRMLAAAVNRLHDAGGRVVNVDVVVVTEQPKIGPHREAIRAALASVLGVSPMAVSVKGKTNEGVDATGRGEALAVHAVATVAGIGLEPAGATRA
jgi:2-C-methyl-D-erythritol 4-phosphate cytidylyltransferase/2-C-methyl-D-erythritol 2,4-cyclodiphosphate synthase